MLMLALCTKAGPLCLVYSKTKDNLLKTKKSQAHLYDGAPDSFETENSYIKGRSNLGSLATKFEH